MPLDTLLSAKLGHGFDDSETSFRVNKPVLQAFCPEKRQSANFANFMVQPHLPNFHEFECQSVQVLALKLFNVLPVQSQFSGK